MNRKLKQWLTSGLAGLLVTAGVAVADETEVKVKSDETKNPITGTVTNKKKVKRKKQAGDMKATSETTDIKKTKTDGSVETKEKSESETDTSAN
jgi:hypothetical protein